ncbi:MAG: HEAT repeat domain-containing protein [Candidatus Kapaibacterium sp.]
MTTKSEAEILISDPNAEHRKKAADNILKMRAFDEASISALILGLSDSDPGVRDSCARALSVQDAVHAGERAAAAAPLIANDEIVVRNLAGEILIKLEASAHPSLIPLLKHPNKDVRKYACDILGITGNSSVSNYLYPLLEDNDINVAASAVEALGNTGSEKAVDFLIDKYEKNEDLKPFIIEAIGKIGGINAQAFLIAKMKEEKDRFLNTACIDALAYSGEDISLSWLLIDELENTPKQLQPVLLKTIFAIAHRTRGSIEFPVKYKPLARQAANDDDPEIMAAGLIALGDCYDIEDLPYIIKILNIDDTDIQEHIFYRLLVNSAPEVIREFMVTYYNSISTDGIFHEFIAFSVSYMDKAPEKNIVEVINTALDLSISGPPTDKNKIAVLLSGYGSLFTKSLKEKILISKIGDIEDIIDFTKGIPNEGIINEILSFKIENREIKDKLRKIRN